MYRSKGALRVTLSQDIQEELLFKKLGETKGAPVIFTPSHRIYLLTCTLRFTIRTSLYYFKTIIFRRDSEVPSSHGMIKPAQQELCT